MSAATILGLGQMGRVLAAALIDAGHRTTVWNRSPGRDAELLVAGAVGSCSARQAIADGGVIIICLYDHASVHQVLDPIAAQLEDRTVINLTTSTPGEARELAGWAADRQIGYLDGAIMATPPMIQPRSGRILYASDRSVFDEHAELLSVFGSSTFEGTEPGTAALYDLAMLSAMYVMFTGFLHGAALTGSAGIRAQDFADRAIPFLTAMAGGMAAMAATVDSGDYATDVQPLEWTELDTLIRACREAGINAAPIALVDGLVREQISLGHGAEAFARIHQSLGRQGQAQP